jgi:hypothetical protein
MTGILDVIKSSEAYKYRDFTQEEIFSFMNTIILASNENRYTFLPVLPFKMNLTELYIGKD